MTETTITNVTTGGRSGIGAVPLTVSVLNFDPTLGCDPETFQPCSDRALSSLKVVGDAFKEIYPINQVLPSDQSPYFGFFIEDKLYGGQVRQQLFDQHLPQLTMTMTPISGTIFCVFQRRRTDL